MDHGQHSGMWVPGEPPTWGRMFLPHLEPWSVLAVAQHRRAARLPARRRPAAALRGDVAVVADAGLGRRHGLAVRRHRHLDSTATAWCCSACT